MPCDPVKLHWLWRETHNRLVIYSRRVQEGKCVDAAVEFARYVQQSGLCDVLGSLAQDGPLKVDGALLRSIAKDLESSACDFYKTGRIAPIEMAVLESIEHKLNLIAGHIAQTPVATFPAQRADDPNAGTKVVPLPSARA